MSKPAAIDLLERMKLRGIVSGLCLLLGGFTCAATSGTQFNYQGRLMVGGVPPTGSYDLRFGLYPTNGDGSPVATLLTNTGVAISNGLFTTSLDFGPVFDGTPYWLEIGVRTNGSTNDFFTLSPRQTLGPVPYAMFASTARSISGVLA